MAAATLFVVFIILVALAFDFTNGMHDAANSIATVVSTRVLTPRQAVIWAAFFNFIAFLIFGTRVAHTIGAGMINLSVVTPTVIFAALLGAIGWNLFTWYMGLPTSSSHALIGGYAGAAIVKAGPQVIIAAGWVKTVLFIFIAPLIGLLLGVLFITVTTWVVRGRNPTRINKAARRLQLLSAALYSLGHGGNDAQKTMGIIASLIYAAGWIKTFHIPLWIVLSAQAAIALGTLSGGWRIVKTMGQKITKLRPIDGFCAETASAISIFFATHAGVPVSTTHVITGAISGVGAAKRLTAVRWGVTLRIVWAWLFTIPGAALAGGLFYFLINLVDKHIF
ncbi:MAG TPA: inorganic phosphate transporter [Candidatus Aminicenantes bacterium]|nr:inorganic phosphate transporter [Candidatus Aminicenantes bacterium]HRY64954.1 inorganic phosphate transporter [Candidatus Aminicenantes bacterium]HRZ71867.1 inorganic phosphate transporter [Candidatus Aminicenantes bacterium]